MDVIESETGRAEVTFEPAGEWLALEKILDACERGETGDAELLAARYAGRIAYDHSEHKWYCFESHAWRTDRTRSVANLLANEIAAQYLFAAAQVQKRGGKGELDLSRALTRRADVLRSRRRIDNALERAKSQPALALSGHEWQRDPLLLACANGVLNLRASAFEFRAGEPGDRLRTVIPTEWQGFDAPAPRWELFLREILGDRELVAFVQRLFGYALAGQVTEHILPILYGEGRNGKDTLLETLAHVLGEIASPVGGEVLIDNARNPGSATPHLVALRHLRLAWVSETNEGARLNAAQVKQLTGGGTITARPLYGEPITYKPTHTLLLVTNHRPHANADDYALWSRVLLVPFNQRFVDEPRADNEHARDYRLAEKLKSEAPGILAWLVRGCGAWQRAGLLPPATIRAATAEYREREDTLAEFIDERCVSAPQVRVRAGELYAAYKEWAEKNGYAAMSGRAFGDRLAKRYGKTRTEMGVLYSGIGLRML